MSEERTVFTVNNKVAVEPPELKGVEVRVNNAFATVVQRTTLARAKVVCAYSAPGLVLFPGDEVLVNGSHLTSVASAVQEAEGIKFVLIEAAQVQAVVR